MAKIVDIHGKAGDGLVAGVDYYERCGREDCDCRKGVCGSWALQFLRNTGQILPPDNHDAQVLPWGDAPKDAFDSFDGYCGTRRHWPACDDSQLLKATHEAKELLNIFTTVRDRERVSSVMLWAFGRHAATWRNESVYECDHRWIEITPDMATFVQHLRAKKLLLEFEHAMRIPEFWTRHYFMFPPHSEGWGGKAWPWSMFMGLHLELDCSNRCFDAILRKQMALGCKDVEVLEQYKRWRAMYDGVSPKDYAFESEPLGGINRILKQYVELTELR